MSAGQPFRGAPPRPSNTDFRAVAGTFATGITIITACVDGIDHAMTANAFTSVSLDPPLVLVCVEKVTRFHQAVVDGDPMRTGWAVSILDVTGRQAAKRFARRGRPLANQLAGYGRARGEHTNAMIIDGALGVLECRTYAVHDGGDHSIVIGEVLTVLGPRPEGAPLLYFRGDYRELAAGDPED